MAPERLPRKTGFGPRMGPPDPFAT
jgi:hypothetical protein